MSAHPPPVPPEQQAPHGGGSTTHDVSDIPDEKAGTAPNTAEQGNPGNTRENTTHPGTGKGF